MYLILDAYTGICIAHMIDDSALPAPVCSRVNLAVTSAVGIACAVTATGDLLQWPLAAVIEHARTQRCTLLTSDRQHGDDVQCLLVPATSRTPISSSLAALLGTSVASTDARVVHSCSAPHAQLLVLAHASGLVSVWDAARTPFVPRVALPGTEGTIVSAHVVGRAVGNVHTPPPSRLMLTHPDVCRIANDLVSVLRSHATSRSKHTSSSTPPGSVPNVAAVYVYVFSGGRCACAPAPPLRVCDAQVACLRTSTHVCVCGICRTAPAVASASAACHWRREDVLATYFLATSVGTERDAMHMCDGIAWPSHGVEAPAAARALVDALSYRAPVEVPARTAAAMAVILTTGGSSVAGVGGSAPTSFVASLPFIVLHIAAAAAPVVGHAVLPRDSSPSVSPLNTAWDEIVLRYVDAGARTVRVHRAVLCAPSLTLRASSTRGSRSTPSEMRPIAHAWAATHVATVHAMRSASLHLVRAQVEANQLRLQHVTRNACSHVSHDMVAVVRAAAELWARMDGGATRQLVATFLQAVFKALSSRGARVDAASFIQASVRAAWRWPLLRAAARPLLDEPDADAAACDATAVMFTLREDLMHHPHSHALSLDDVCSAAFSLARLDIPSLAHVLAVAPNSPATAWTTSLMARASAPVLSVVEHAALRMGGVVALAQCRPRMDAVALDSSLTLESFHQPAACTNADAAMLEAYVRTQGCATVSASDRLCVLARQLSTSSAAQAGLAAHVLLQPHVVVHMGALDDALVARQDTSVLRRIGLLCALPFVSGDTSVSWAAALERVGTQGVPAIMDGMTNCGLEAMVIAIVTHAHACIAAHAPAAAGTLVSTGVRIVVHAARSAPDSGSGPLVARVLRAAVTMTSGRLSTGTHDDVDCAVNLHSMDGEYMQVALASVTHMWEDLRPMLALAVPHAATPSISTPAARASHVADAFVAHMNAFLPAAHTHGRRRAHCKPGHEGQDGGGNTMEACAARFMMEYAPSTTRVHAHTSAAQFTSTAQVAFARPHMYFDTLVHVVTCIVTYTRGCPDALLDTHTDATLHAGVRSHARAVEACALRRQATGELHTYIRAIAVGCNRICQARAAAQPVIDAPVALTTPPPVGEYAVGDILARVWVCVECGVLPLLVQAAADSDNDTRSAAWACLADLMRALREFVSSYDATTHDAAGDAVEHARLVQLATGVLRRLGDADVVHTAVKRLTLYAQARRDGGASASTLESVDVALAALHVVADALRDMSTFRADVWRVCTVVRVLVELSLTAEPSSDTSLAMKRRASIVRGGSSRSAAGATVVGARASPHALVTELARSMLTDCACLCTDARMRALLAEPRADAALARGGVRMHTWVSLHTIVCDTAMDMMSEDSSMGVDPASVASATARILHVLPAATRALSLTLLSDEVPSHVIEVISGLWGVAACMWRAAAADHSHLQLAVAYMARLTHACTRTHTDVRACAYMLMCGTHREVDDAPPLAWSFLLSLLAHDGSEGGDARAQVEVLRSCATAVVASACACVAARLPSVDEHVHALLAVMSASQVPTAMHTAASITTRWIHATVDAKTVSVYLPRAGMGQSIRSRADCFAALLTACTARCPHDPVCVCPLLDALCRDVCTVLPHTFTHALRDVTYVDVSSVGVPPALLPFVNTYTMRYEAVARIWTLARVVAACSAAAAPRLAAVLDTAAATITAAAVVHAERVTVWHARDPVLQASVAACLHAIACACGRDERVRPSLEAAGIPLRAYTHLHAPDEDYACVDAALAQEWSVWAGSQARFAPPPAVVPAQVSLSTAGHGDPHMQARAMAETFIQLRTLGDSLRPGRRVALEDAAVPVTDGVATSPAAAIASVAPPMATAPPQAPSTMERAAAVPLESRAAAMADTAAAMARVGDFILDIQRVHGRLLLPQTAFGTLEGALRALGFTYTRMMHASCESRFLPQDAPLTLALLVRCVAACMTDAGIVRLGELEGGATATERVAPPQLPPTAAAAAVNSKVTEPAGVTATSASESVAASDRGGGL